VRLLYVTSSFPYGHGEGFLTVEARELLRQGHELTVVPALARGPVLHEDASELVGRTRRVPLLSREVSASAGVLVAREPRRTIGVVGTLARSRTPRILVKNLSAAPKALWLAALAREVDAEHIHAHWGATSATLAMVASELSGVPWSLTVHRWDIRENNLLGRKAASASFVRAISRDGLRDLRRVAGRAADDAFVLHMGVEVPPTVAQPTTRDVEAPLRLLVPANLLEVKGHRHLIEALALLGSRDVRVHAAFAGEGELRPQLERQIASLRLEGACTLLGQRSHAELVGQLREGRWDAVALASILTPSGEKEGIPVALLEAMSYGLPVIGTNAGGVPELLGSGAGLLVPPGDPPALAEAIERLARDEALRGRLGRLGRERVASEFDVVRIVRELGERFEAASRPNRHRAH